MLLSRRGETWTHYWREQFSSENFKTKALKCFSIVRKTRATVKSESRLWEGRYFISACRKRFRVYFWSFLGRFQVGNLPVASVATTQDRPQVPSLSG
jgi:hypothetical protein